MRQLRRKVPSVFELATASTVCFLRAASRNLTHALIMERQMQAFTEEQRSTILKHVSEILHTDISTIEEIGGGGIRCMMGELF